MEEYRCHNEKCMRLLLKEEIIFGRFEIKCPRCGYINQFKYLLEDEQERMTGVFTADPVLTT